MNLAQFMRLLYEIREILVLSIFETHSTRIWDKSIKSFEMHSNSISAKSTNGITKNWKTPTAIEKELEKYPKSSNPTLQLVLI